MNKLLHGFVNAIRGKMNIFTKGGITIVNGVSYSGNNIRIENGVLTIDGVRQKQIMDHEVHVNVQGDAEHIDAGSGSVRVAGNAMRISTGSGSIKCGDVDGSVKTGSGSISCESQNDI